MQPLKAIWARDCFRLSFQRRARDATSLETNWHKTGGKKFLKATLESSFGALRFQESEMSNAKTIFLVFIMSEKNFKM